MTTFVLSHATIFRRLAYSLIAAVALAAVIFVSVKLTRTLAASSPPGNQGQGYRLPWEDGVSHGCFGGCPPGGGWYLCNGEYSDCTHHGAGAVDFNLGLWENVYAIGDGTLVNIVDNSYDGLFMEIDHNVDDWTVRSRYFHLCGSYLGLGSVVQGDLIGAAGNTGQVYPEPEEDCQDDTGVHLHFDTHEGGQSVAWARPLSNRDEGDFINEAYASNNRGVSRLENDSTNVQIRMKYLQLGGWEEIGSPSKMEPGTDGYRVCAAHDTRAVEYCDVGPVQAFRDENGQSRQALIENVSLGSAFHLQGGSYGCYTKYHDGQPWAYWMGPPIEDDHQIDSYNNEQQFLYDYRIRWRSNPAYSPYCWVYQWQTTKSGSSWQIVWSQGGERYSWEQTAPAPGYGSDGD